MPGCRWLMRQSGQGQLRHVGHIGIGDMTPTALCEHGGDPLQIQIPFFDRQGASGIHDGCKLGVGKTKHVPMMTSNGLFKDQCQSMRNRDASKDEDYSRHCHCCIDHSGMRSQPG
jgi:hypothetical protein